VLQHGGSGRRFQAGKQADFLLFADAAWAAGNRFALERAGLTLLDHGALHRGHGTTKAASGFSHGLTLSHRSHQSFFAVG
jgi:hypothetical protein